MKTQIFKTEHPYVIIDWDARTLVNISLLSEAEAMKRTEKLLNENPKKIYIAAKVMWQDESREVREKVNLRTIFQEYNNDDDI